MSPGANIGRARAMARHRIVDLIIGAAIALALISIAPGHAPTLNTIPRMHVFDLGIVADAQR